jgi:hypothetical protein
MTIEQLLDLPASGLEAIPDAELLKMLEPYFKFTRPAVESTKGMLLPRVGVSSKVKTQAVKQSAGVRSMIKNIDFAEMTDEKFLAMRELLHGKKN